MEGLEPVVPEGVADSEGFEELERGGGDGCCYWCW